MFIGALSNFMLQCTRARATFFAKKLAIADYANTLDIPITLKAVQEAPAFIQFPARSFQRPHRIPVPL